MRVQWFCFSVFVCVVSVFSQVACPARDSLQAARRQTEVMQMAALECDPSAFPAFRSPSPKVIQRALELDCANFTSVNRPDRKALATAAQSARDSARCVAPLQSALGEKNKSWVALRKELVRLQPQAVFSLYGSKLLSDSEKRHMFQSPHVLSTEVCQELWDSAGVAVLFPSDWKSRSFAPDSTPSSCLMALESSLVPFLQEQLDPAAFRTRLLNWFPQSWQRLFGDSASEQEKARYVTHPALQDTSFCRYADWTTPDQLVSLGISRNACADYIHDRFGSALFMLQFRRDFTPAAGNAFLERMSRLDSSALLSNRSFLDSLNQLLGSVENWEFIDSVEARTLHMLSRNPQVLRAFQDPTAPMILAAANGNPQVLCEYPVTDRMLGKFLMDRLQDDLPLPDAEAREGLKNCLQPALWSELERMLSQLQAGE